MLRAKDAGTISPGESVWNQCRARLLAGIHGAQGSTRERVWQRLTSLDACHFTRRSVYAATGPSARRLLAAMATWDVGGLQHDGTGLACGSSSRSDRRLPPPTEHRSYASMSPRKCRLRPGPTPVQLASARATMAPVAALLVTPGARAHLARDPTSRSGAGLSPFMLGA